VFPQVRTFNSLVNAAKAIGVSSRHFARIARTLGIKPAMFGRNGKYTREQVERVRREREAC